MIRKPLALKVRRRSTADAETNCRRPVPLCAARLAESPILSTARARAWLLTSPPYPSDERHRSQVDTLVPKAQPEGRDDATPDVGVQRPARGVRGEGG